MISFKRFLRKFSFNARNAGCVGIEREGFLINGHGRIVPMASEVLERLPDRNRFGYEFSRCQLEHKIGPCRLSEIEMLLERNEWEIGGVLGEFGLGLSYEEVAPSDMPMDVYPDKRYERLARVLSSEKLSAAFRVIGTHIHIGMPNLQTAIRVHDGVCAEWERLARLGDHSGGERMRLYGIVAPAYTPNPYGSVDGFYRAALEEGFSENPRDCWRIIRISKYGTIEFRMFGATGDRSEIIEWTEECLRLCQLLAL